ncbi:LPXTG cell wall anchor domain-containing protein [Sphingobacterium chuzhouense]|uniref:LPXTG cell wall anchor domain-containing protein n=1 Tax=Sphingobacterium chuzhouense TaxID=1742264 RepID=A0ABR7XQ59_9SPHI|nr:LPXTG cell wall anchor domain-containing protein [Sphingobacterium chuzhouense]
MRKVGFMILFSYFTLLARASQHINTEGEETSPTAAIIVGAIILLLIIVVLYRRQKRKFNE